MPKEFSRTQRIGEQLQRELATLIQQEIRDPRMGMVTVSHVDVTTDLAHAKVYVSVFNEQDIVESIKILNKAGGFLRHQLGKNLRLRTIPELRFVYDKSISHGSRLSALIDAAVSTDIKNKEQDKQ